MKGANHVGVHPEPELRYISLFSGGAGLDLGFNLAVRKARAVCYVEREIFACSVLVKRIQDQVIDDAPIWSDVTTFRGEPWRGKVSGIIGGFPCQNISGAGKGEGITGARSGLWAEYARIIDEVRPAWVVIENVPPLVTRGLGWVLQDLAALGYDAEWDTFSAEEVGAPQRRNRFFLVAWLVESNCVRKQQCEGDEPERGGRPRDKSKKRRPVVARANSSLSGSRQNQPQAGGEPGHPVAPHDRDSVADAHSSPVRIQPEDTGRLQRISQVIAAVSSETIPDPAGLQSSKDRQSGVGLEGRPDAGLCRCELGDTQGERLEGRGLCCAEYPNVWLPLQASSPMVDRPVFPPGPGDYDGWAFVRASMPGLEPAICRVAPELAPGMDKPESYRTPQLRLLGNGVVPLTAALAISILALRAELTLPLTYTQPQALESPLPSPARKGSR